MINQGMMSTGNTEHETPQDFYDMMDAEFHFDLDVCATDDNAKCDYYFDKEVNGLLQEWYDVCWMNPPYGRGVIDWVSKAYFEARDGNATVVALLPARTDTKWFHTYIYGKAEIRFLRGRLKFSDSVNAAPFPSMIVVWRKEA